MEINNINIYPTNDSVLLAQIGDFIKNRRLSQNKTQQQVATAAGVNRSTIMLLEKGSGGTLGSFIRVLRVLEQLHVLEVFEVKNKVSPIQLARLEKSKRQRARTIPSIK